MVSTKSKFPFSETPPLQHADQPAPGILHRLQGPDHHRPVLGFSARGPGLVGSDQGQPVLPGQIGGDALQIRLIENFHPHPGLAGQRGGQGWRDLGRHRVVSRTRIPVTLVIQQMQVSKAGGPLQLRQLRCYGVQPLRLQGGAKGVGLGQATQPVQVILADAAKNIMGDRQVGVHLQVELVVGGAGPPVDGERQGDRHDQHDREQHQGEQLVAQRPLDPFDHL